MNPAEITARTATPQDEDFLRRLFYIVRAPEFAAAGMTPEQLEPFLAQQYLAMRTYYAQAFPETVYSILESNGEPMGYEALRDTNELHLIDIALMPDYRNQGIGSYRMELLKQLARDAGKEILLSVEIFNPARLLYERLGFETIEEKGIYRRMLWTPPKE